MTRPIYESRDAAIAARFARRTANLERRPSQSDWVFVVPVTREDATVTTGNGQRVFPIPRELDGLSLVAAHAWVSTESSSGDLTIQIRNITQTDDMLSTEITIDAGEFTSYAPGTTESVVDPAAAEVATGDLIAVDVDADGTGAEGLGVILTFS